MLLKSNGQKTNHLLRVFVKFIINVCVIFLNFLEPKQFPLVYTLNSTFINCSLFLSPIHISIPNLHTILICNKSYKYSIHAVHCSICYLPFPNFTKWNTSQINFISKWSRSWISLFGAGFLTKTLKARYRFISCLPKQIQVIQYEKHKNHPDQQHQFIPQTHP